MNKVLISLAVLLSSYTISSQSRKVVIDKCINKSEIHGPTGMICSNLNKTKWFTLTPEYRLDGSRLSCDGLWAIRMDIGNLSKEDQIFIIFTDGTKLRLESGIELTSEKSIYFKLEDSIIILSRASSKKIQI